MNRRAMKTEFSYECSVTTSIISLLPDYADQTATCVLLATSVKTEVELRGVGSLQSNIVFEIILL